MIEKINIGFQANDGTGDTIREAFGKVNNNFDALQDRVLDLDAIEVTLSNKANRSEIPSIVGLASETLVNQKIAQAVIGLVNRQELESGLNTKPDFSDLPSLDGYATQTYVNQRLITSLVDYITTAQLAQALASKANRSEIPSIEGLASETWVRQLINDTEFDLSNYFTKSEVLAKIAEAQLDGGDVDLSGYATLTFVNNGLNGKVDRTELSTYATRTWVTSQINAIPQVDLTSYATKAYVNSQIGTIDLTSYATRAWVTSQINNQTVDLSAYYNKTQVDNLLSNKANRNEIPSLVGYASETYVQNAIANIPSVNLDGYATETFVQNSIANKADRSELVDFITIMDVPSKTSDLTNDSGFVTSQALNGFATESYVQNAIANAELGDGETIDLTIYETIASNDAKLATKADRSEIPSLNGYATQIYVDNKVASIPSVDLTPYALKTDLNVYDTVASVDSKLSQKANVSDLPNISGLASEAYVDQAIANAELGGGTVDLSNYYTKGQTYSKVEVDDKLSLKANAVDIPSVAGLASETYVNNVVNGAVADKADRSEIPSVVGLASEAYVDNAVSSIPAPINPFANGFGIESISNVFASTDIDITNVMEINNKALVNINGAYVITNIGNNVRTAFSITNMTANASLTLNVVSGKTITINGELMTASTLLNMTQKPLLFFIYDEYVMVRY